MFDSSFRYGVSSFRRFVMSFRRFVTAFRRFSTPILLVELFFQVFVKVLLREFSRNIYAGKTPSSCQVEQPPLTTI